MPGACNGNIVETVRQGSPADRAGIMPGDTILMVNRKKINDLIDFLFYTDTPEVTISLKRSYEIMKVKTIRNEGEDIGIEFRSFRIKTCKNNCIFCFVDQLPRGLRKSLYIKDEDYRMSFLYGNYITLSNLTPVDKKRIVEQRLSPLYISVHSTNSEVRSKLLGNNNIPDIMTELRWLTKHKIRIHTQIILCPGHNDGDNLRKTIQDLHKFYPYISSIAVVPVGLTRHKKRPLQPVGKEEAVDTLKLLSDFQKRFLKRHGDAFVYGADELYILAEKKFPPLKHYGEFPQLENGIGMVPYFISGIKKTSLPKTLVGQRVLTITGVSFYPFLKGFIEHLKEKIQLNLIPIENKFFGNSVTVTGLLTGRDIIRDISDKCSDYDLLLLPDIILRDGGDVFLDGISVKEMEQILGIKVNVIESTAKGLIAGLKG